MKQLEAAQAAKTQKALNVLVRVNGGALMTRRALVDKCIAEGYVIATRPNGERVLMSPGGTWFDAGAITKAGLYYAEQKVWVPACEVA